jgi:hypothetical protein
MMTWPLVALVVAVLAQSPSEQEAAQSARQERLQFIKERASRFTLARDGSPQQPLKLTDDPVLRYDIPERDNGTWDGGLFLWLEGGRPVAALCVGIRRPNNAVARELTSFSATPLVCHRSGEIAWNPRTGGLLNQPLSDAPLPANSATGRLPQLRSLARRFSATCIRREVATELRLMPQPLYRFSNEMQGIVDGALFALAVGNDAELLLLIEAVESTTGQQPVWRYSLARMSSLDLKVRLDDAEIWSVPRFYTIPADDRKTSPYLEAMEGRFGAGAKSQVAQ